MTKQSERKTMKLRSLLRIGAVICAVILLVYSLTPGGYAFWRKVKLAVGLSSFAEGIDGDGLLIHVIDVGKADAILIECGGTALMVDTGTGNSTDKLLRYLEDRQITGLDALFLSHGDSDHTGGAEAILENMPVGEIVCSPYTSVPDIYANAKCMRMGDIEAYGDLIIEVLAPEEELKSENDNSLVFRLWYGTFSMLFCGDIERDAEEMLLNSGQELHADVLKIAHHGSDTSTSDEFLAAVSPRYAVISSGEDRNLLPRNTVLKRLSDAGAEFYRTDKHGSVVLSVNGEDINITTERD